MSRLALLLSLLVFLPACDSGADGDSVADFSGIVWQGTNEETENNFLVFSDLTLVSYEELRSGCAIRGEPNLLLRLENGRYQSSSDVDADGESFSIRRDGDRLTIQEFSPDGQQTGEPDVFARSSRTEESLRSSCGG